MKIHQSICLGVVCLSLVGCVKAPDPTAYAKSFSPFMVGGPIGYMDHKKGNDIYQIDYSACPQCPMSQSAKYARRRASELVVKNNCKSYKILSETHQVENLENDVGNLILRDDYPTTTLRVKLLGCVK